MTETTREEAIMASTKEKSKCVSCSGRGYRWARGRMGEGYMVKRECSSCKGTGLIPPPKTPKTKKEGEA